MFNYTEYYESIKSHLKAYKNNTLGIIEDGIYKGNNLSYGHILPDYRKYENITANYRKDFIKYLQTTKIKLHKDFHHLNSSQALCFNLFFPFIVENKFSILFKCLGVIDNVKNCELEYIEDQNEFTNYDFYINGEKAKYYFEVKYTEKRFDDEEMDVSHIKKYESIYKDKLAKIGNIKIEYFFENYQIFRNILNAVNGIVVFIIPNQRKDLYERLVEVKSKVNCQNTIYILPIEDIIKMAVSNDMDRFKSSFIEFREKYLTTAST